MFNRNRRLTSILVAGLFGGAALVAQQSSGGIKGRVIDQGTGAPKGGVAITIEHTSTGFTRSMMSNSDGSFRFPVLPIGNYRLTFKTPDSMASMIRTVQLGQDTEVHAVLKPRAEATVTVVATADTVGQVNTTSAEQSVNVTAERLENLPVLSRNVMSAAVLAPGVQLVQGSSVDPTKKASTYISTGEGQGRGVNMNIDGGDNNSSDVGGYVSSIPMDAIGEFQVVTNMYKAEFGRSNAGFFNIVSKSGTNAFAGSMNAQYTNQSMRARSTDEGKKTDNNSQSISAVVSGPIIKDKLFYMVAAEKRDEESAPATFAPLAVGFYPELRSIKSELDATTIYTRLDWNINNMMSLMWTTGYDHNKTPNQIFPWGAGQNGYIEPSLLGTGENKTWRTTLKLTTSFSPNLTWESNLTYFDYKNEIYPNGPGSGDGTNLFVFTIPSGLSGGPSTAAEAMGFGHDPNATQNTGIKRIQWRNDVSYVAGDHFLKGGLDFQQYEYADQTLFYPVTGPSTVRIVGFNSPAAVGNTVVADQNVASIRLNPRGTQEGDKIKQFGFYFQDDWTINTNWSIYVGLRVDKDTTFDFMKDYQGLYNEIYATSPEFLRGRSVPKDKTYVSPRAQVVWKPLADDSLTFKLGYGKFVAQVVDNVTGFSRALGNRVNGLPPTLWNQATIDYAGGIRAGGNRVPSFQAGTAWTNFPVNGHIITLPADFTPYNYVNNVGGLRDYFESTVDGWLAPASFQTGGKSLLASNFQYPQTDAFSLGMAFKFNEQHAVDVNYSYSWTDHNSVIMGSDGSDPRASSLGPGGQEMYDDIFLSNQRAASHQVQMKYSYTTLKSNFFMSLVVRDNKSSNGSSAGSFVSGGNADFYGNGTGSLPPYLDGQLRRSSGTELLTGSIAYNYTFDIGTKVGVLGTWHSGKFYELNTGWNAELGLGNGLDVSHPADYAGYREGDWNLDLSLRVSHPFKFGKKMVFEPFLQIQNLLNNYDYGSNYDGTMYLEDADGSGNPILIKNPSYGQRYFGWQANQPRTAAFGFRFAF